MSVQIRKQREKGATGKAGGKQNIFIPEAADFIILFR